MNCIEVQNLLSAYIDNECTKQEESLIKEHLDGCTACLEEYKLIESIINMTHHVDEVELPEGFHSDLMNKIHGKYEQPPKKRPFYTRIYGNSIVAAALLFSIVFGVMGTKMLVDMANQPKSSDSVEFTEELSESERSNIVLYKAAESEMLTAERLDKDIDGDEGGMNEAPRDNLLNESTAMQENSEIEVNMTDDGTNEEFNPKVSNEPYDNISDDEYSIKSSGAGVENKDMKNKDSEPRVMGGLAPDAPGSSDAGSNYEETNISEYGDKSQATDAINDTNQGLTTDEMKEIELGGVLKTVGYVVLVGVAISISIMIFRKKRK